MAWSAQLSFCCINEQQFTFTPNALTFCSAVATAPATWAGASATLAGLARQGTWAVTGWRGPCRVSRAVCVRTSPRPAIHLSPPCLQLCQDCAYRTEGTPWTPGREATQPWLKPHVHTPVGRAREAARVAGGSLPQAQGKRSRCSRCYRGALMSLLRPCSSPPPTGSH